MPILHMRPTEQVCVDQEKLSALYAQLGNAGAEDVVCRAMEELALRLSHCNRLFQDHNWTDLRKNSRSLMPISDQVGLERLASVAGDVVRCIDQRDEVALSATLTRLIRIGERSLTAIWDTQDLSL